MKFPAYDSYQYTGVKWLGNVPTHWRVQSLKSILAERKEKNDPIKSDNILSLTMDRGVIPYSERGGGGNKAKEDLTAYKLAYPNDIVLNSMNVIAGSVGLSKYFGVVSPVYYMLYPRCEDDEVRYFSQIFQSTTFQKSLYGLGNGILVKESESSGKLNTIRMRIPMGRLNSVVLPYPSPDEQKAISSFLDVETSKIDGLVSEQRRLIELLKEKRQAVISHAVTKGLNPNAPMKPSGIQWLGDVPEHWTVSKLKFAKSLQPNAFVDGPFGSNLKSKHFVENGDVYVIESNFATTGRVNPSKLKTITEEHFETVQRSEAKGGDIIIAKIGARFGMSSILPTLDKPALVSGNSMKLTLNDEICDADFVNWQLTNLKQLGAMDDIVNATAQPALSLGGMNGLPILLPGLEEQRNIVHRLRERNLQFDTLLAQAERAIELLQERRTALISAAVTGKIDVREFATQGTA